MKQVLITGANRGIGLALTQQLLHRGFQVYATSRNPAQATALQELQQAYPDLLTLIALDVTQEASIQQAASQLRSHTRTLDWLINNAGVLYRGESITTLSSHQMNHTFQVNAIGPMLTTRYFLPFLQQSPHPIIAQISSIMGSHAYLTDNGYYSYRGSKAALNMMSRVLAHEVRPLGITVLLIHPGWVRTQMGGKEAPVLPEESAQGIIRLLNQATLKDSGRFFDWQGKELSW